MERKILSQYDNPFDNVLYDISAELLPTFHSLNFTPNGITTLSLLSGLGACCYLYNKQFIPFAILYTLSYLFDCMDGAYARKYNMVTEFGDLYDHVKDWTVFAIIFYILTSKYGLFNHKKLLLFSLVMTYMTAVQVGCQEKLYEKEESATLNFTKSLCPAQTREELEQLMPYTRFFGLGSYFLLQIGIAYLLLK